MDVKQILVKYLRDYGYGGLFYDGGECGCVVENLAPCGEIQTDCEPGYRHDCNCGGGCSWHVGPQRAAEHIGEHCGGCSHAIASQSTTLAFCMGHRVSLSWDHEARGPIRCLACLRGEAKERRA